MSYDRFGTDGSGSDDVAARQYEQTREMFRMADNRARCRHQSVTSYLGERIEPCESACDVCSGRDVLDACAPLPGKRGRRGVAAGSPGRARGEQSWPPPPPTDRAATDDGLFESLRALRRRLADARGIPAYMVFSDTTLLQMVDVRPRTPESLLRISGVGPKKLAQYGDAFLALMCETA